MDSDKREKIFAAIVASAIASAPSSERSAIVATAVGSFPEFAQVVSRAANSVPPAAPVAGAPSAETAMVLGNIRVLEVEGNSVECIDAQGKISKLQAGEFLTQGVRIVTGRESRAVLIFENGSSVRVEPGSDFSIEKFTQDPFKPEGLDYRTMQSEPSRSVTRTGVAEGKILFNVADLKASSRYEIVTPVGVAGIRGTGGFALAESGDAGQSGGFGLFDGTAVFTTPEGESLNVEQNNTIAVGAAADGFAITQNPPEGQAALDQAQQGVAQAAGVTTVQPFLGAPPPQQAPPDPMANLTPAQQAVLQQAAAEGTQAVAQAALQMAAETPASAAQIAAAAADLAPAAAGTIARSIAFAIPAQAAGIAAIVASVAPVQAPAIATLVANAVPAQTVAIASSVALVVPLQSAIVAASVSSVAPMQAVAIAVAISTVVPSEAASVAAAVTTVVPAQASALAVAVASAVPEQAAAVAVAVSTVVPAQAPSISASVATAVPAQAVAIAAAVATVLPDQAASISNSVATAVPGQSAAIASAVSAALNALNEAGDAGGATQPTGPPVDQNPGSLTTPTPTPVSPSF